MANPHHLNAIRRIAMASKNLETWHTLTTRLGYSNMVFDLSFSSLKDLDLRGADLRGANLEGAKIERCLLWKANLDDTNMKKCSANGISAWGASFRGADCRDASFIGANFTGADFCHSNLSRCNLKRAYLSEADLVDAVMEEAILNSSVLTSSRIDRANMRRCQLANSHLSGASMSEVDLSDSDLREASLVEAKLSKAKLRNARLTNANLFRADLRRAEMTGADLRYATICEADLTMSTLESASIYGISTWGITGNPKNQQNLVVEASNGLRIIVDDLELAQFVYLLIDHQKLRKLFNAITSRGVLILGKFSDEGLSRIQRIADKLRQLDYLPIIFDFEKPIARNYTETIITLVGLSRFVIAILDGQSVPQELYATIPHFKVPFVPIIPKNTNKYVMFSDLLEYPWVIKPIVEYSEIDELINNLSEQVIIPAEVLCRRREDSLSQLIG